MAKIYANNKQIGAWRAFGQKRVEVIKRKNLQAQPFQLSFSSCCFFKTVA